MQECVKIHWVLPISLLPHRVREERGDSLVFALEGAPVMSVGPGRESPGYQIQGSLQSLARERYE